MQELDQHLTCTPRIDPAAFIAPSVDLIGDVTVGARSSIWFQCVVRGDINAIRIGDESNIQDGTIIHVSSTLATVVGDRVSCGHRAILHACNICDEVLIGMGAIVMDGAEIGEQSIVGAGALVKKGMLVPSGVLVLGSPARVVRELTEAERQSIPALAAKYCTVSAEYAHARSGAASDKP